MRPDQEPNRQQTPEARPRVITTWHYIAAALTLAAALLIVATTWALYITEPTPARSAAPGPTTAPKPVLTEFGDFQCPHCARFARDIYPRLKADFIDTDRITFRYRHLPFINRNSFTMALAAECARDQRRFDQFHDRIFSAQFLAATEEPDTSHRQALKDTAATLKLDTAQFDNCLDSRQHQETIKADIRDAELRKVRGTPTLFLGHHPVNWTDYPSLKRRLNHMLDRWPTTQPEHPTF